MRGEAATGARRAAPAPLLPFASITVRTALWSVLLGIGLIAPFMIAASYSTPSEVVRLKMGAVPLHPLTFLFASGLLGPLLEEMIYRGFFQGILRRYAPLWVAVVVPAAVFAATHIVPAGWAYLNAFPMACLFSWLVLRSGSLFASLLCHCTFNLAAGLALTPIFHLAEKLLERAPGAPFNPLFDLFPIWWTALSLVLVGSAMVMIHRDTASRRAANHA